MSKVLKTIKRVTPNPVKRSRSIKQTTATQEASAPTPGEQAAVILRVQVVGCADLLGKDKSGKSDPFVVVNLGRERYSTPVIKKSVNPEYPAEKATFDFPIYRSNAGYLGALEFVVWDKDLLRKDYIGEAAIPFDEWFKHHEPSPAFAFDDPRNTPFPVTIISSRKNTQAQGTIQLKIGFVPVDPAFPPNYAAMFSEFQQLAKMSGLTLHSSVPTRGIGTTLVGESELEDDGLSSADEESGDEMDEGTTPASATSTGSTPLSSTPSSRKNTQPPPILAPTPSQSLKPPTTSPGFLPKVLSPGPRSATAGKEYFEGAQSSESSRPASRTGKKRPSFKKEFDSNFKISSNNDIVGIVMLEIQGAEDLPKLKNMTRTGWDMDPFCVISFGKKVFRTRVIRHSLDPVWNEKLLFHVHRTETNFKVNFAVLDWDKLSGNDNIGSVSFSLPELMANVPKPNPETMIYPESVASGEHDMTEYKLPIVTDKSAPWEFKHAPVLKFRAKYQPYRALRQKFWREYLKQYDMDGNDRISHLELTSMLDSLGSTLSKETIDSFFTRFNVSPREGDLSFEQVIICLEEAVHKPMEQRKRVTTDQQVPDTGVPTPMLSDSPKEDANRSAALGPLDFSGPAARPPTESAIPEETLASMPAVNTNQQPTNKPLQVPTPPDATRSVSDQTLQGGEATPVAAGQQPASHAVPPVSAVPRSPTDLLNEELDEEDRGSGSSGDEVVERVINIRTCPLCHRPRMNSKGETDIVTHLAVCASSDWARVDRMLVGNYVTPSQAQRKWYTKVITKVSSGAYEIGANSANIIVQNRETGQLEEEKMQGYVRLGIRLLYKGARSRMEGARARKLLKSLSVKQGIKFDAPESAREIMPFIAFHNLDTNEILDPLDSFKNFNEFFYRKLKNEARLLSEPDNPNRLVSVADCRSMFFESVEEATRIWIKGREFSVARLLGDAYKEEASKYVGGALGIFRLAPQDYHRFHVPVDGRIGKMTYIAGEYYTVNPQAIRTSLDVYGENARKIVPIDSPQFGRVMCVCVGAMMVGSIVTTVEEGSEVKRGDEFGYFAFGGSTIVCLFEKGAVEWDEDLLINAKSSLETLSWKEESGLDLRVSWADVIGWGGEKKIAAKPEAGVEGAAFRDREAPGQSARGVRRSSYYTHLYARLLPPSSPPSRLMSASQQQQISLAVVSDIICPWCYIGYKELTRAIDQFKKVNAAAKVDVEYRPFLLDPKLSCKEPQEKTAYFLKKFGEQRAKMIMPAMNNRGAELGIKFRWGGTIRQTTSAHRLLMFAYQKEPKLQLALLEKIFEAYFEQEKDIGSHEMLAGLAEEAGVASKDEALEFLASDKLYTEVQAQIMEAQGKGITGVPCTVINQKYAISGGQKSDVYIDIFEKLAAREIPVS